MKNEKALSGQPLNAKCWMRLGQSGWNLLANLQLILLGWRASDERRIPVDHPGPYPVTVVWVRAHILTWNRNRQSSFSGLQKPQVSFSHASRAAHAEPRKSTFCSICKGSNFRKKITDHITSLIRRHLRYYKSKHLFNGKHRRKTGYTGSTPFLMAYQCTGRQEISFTL